LNSVEKIIRRKRKRGNVEERGKKKGNWSKKGKINSKGQKRQSEGA
jgi:hypothetical protein